MASLGDFLLSDNGYVVLRLAGDRARITADASIEVYGHSPLVLWVLPCGEQRQFLRDAFFLGTGEFWIFMKLFVGGGAKWIVLLHGLCMLGVGELVTT